MLVNKCIEHAFVHCIVFTTHRYWLHVMPVKVLRHSPVLFMIHMNNGLDEFSSILVATFISVA